MKNKLTLTILISLFTLPSYAGEILGFPNISWGDSIEKVVQNISYRENRINRIQISSNYSIENRDINNVFLRCDLIPESEFIYIDDNDSLPMLIADFSKSGLYRIDIHSPMDIKDKEKASASIKSITNYLEDIYGEPETYREDTINNAYLNKVYKNGKITFTRNLDENTYKISFYPNGVYRTLRNLK